MMALSICTPQTVCCMYMDKHTYLNPNASTIYKETVSILNMSARWRLDVPERKHYNTAQ